MASEKKEGFTVSTAAHLRSSLAQRLIPAVDRIRDLNTRFGTRPYRVWIIRTRFTGPRRGMGVEEVTNELEILPTPMVIDMRSLSQIVTPIGVNEQGSIQIQHISGRYTEEMLLGTGPDGSHVSLNESVYYEVEFFRRDGGTSERRRFVMDTIPTYVASQFQWQITVSSALENRSRDRSPG